MVSKYDIFYVIAVKGPLRVPDILDEMGRKSEDYQIIFNHVLELEKTGLVNRGEAIAIEKNERTVLLYRIIRFCTDNRINYNLLLKQSMVDFIEQASRSEFITIKDVDINPRTFSFYLKALSKCGLLLVISRRPLKCKLLRHGFFNDIFRFHGKELAFYEPKKDSMMEQIKRELKRYKDLSRIGYSILDELERKKEVEFIYGSLHLEGNPMTLPETQKLILEEIVPEKHKIIHIQEVTSYKKAIDLMIENARNDEELTLDLILKYHRMGMEHIHCAGKLRQQNVRIKGNPEFKTCEWRLIPIRIRELMEEYSMYRSSKRDTTEVIKFASYFHNEFQRIHPFIDGNSRISRLLMLHILRSSGLPMLDLPLGYYDIYMDLTKRSKERDDEAFRYIIEEMVYFSLKRINDDLS